MLFFVMSIGLLEILRVLRVAQPRQSRCEQRQRHDNVATFTRRKRKEFEGKDRKDLAVLRRSQTRATPSLHALDTVSNAFETRTHSRRRSCYEKDRPSHI